MPRTDKPSQRSKGRRSGGGRPPKEGARYANGRLKPEPPNPIVVAARAKVGIVGLGQRATPLEVIQANGWLSDSDLAIAALYTATYRNADLCLDKLEFKPAAPFDRLIAERNAEPWEAMLDFSQMPRKVIAEIWDRAFRDHVDRYDDSLAAAAPAPAADSQDVAARNDGPAKAMRRWKAMQAAMTKEQRQVVTDLCIHDSWPQWVIQRCAGNMTTSWESRRTVLIEGLSAIRMAVWAARPKPVANDDAPSPKPAPSSGPKYIHVERILNDNDEVTLEVVRISRCPPDPEAA